MDSHQKVWNAIDTIVWRARLSPSGLAKTAGMDATAFNRSKRVRYARPAALAECRDNSEELRCDRHDVVRVRPSGRGRAASCLSEGLRITSAAWWLLLLASRACRPRIDQPPVPGAPDRPLPLPRPTEDRLRVIVPDDEAALPGPQLDKGRSIPGRGFRNLGLRHGDRRLSDNDVPSKPGNPSEFHANVSLRP